MKENLLEVEILGRVYRIRSQKDSEYLKKLANYVDQKMKEVQEVAPTADAVKIAVLSALNIADELFETKLQAEGVSGNAEERIQSLLGRIESAIQDNE